LEKYQEKDKNTIIVLDIPLLFETGFNNFVQFTIVVGTDEKTQIDRSVSTLKITPEEARRRIRFQMPLEDKIRMADITINNGGTLKETQKQVEGIWQKLLQKTKK